MEINNIHLRETPDIETSSEGYGSRFSGEIGDFFLQTQTQATLEMLEPWKGCSVLDVGGGHGQNVVPLLENGYTVTVFGSAPECNIRLNRQPGKGLYEFVCGDIVKLPFTDRAFDIVISYRLLSHVNQWKRLITEMTRVSRIGVIIDYPSIWSINIISPLLFKVKKAIEKNTRVFFCFNEKMLFREFKRNGLQLHKKYPEFFFPMVMHRFLRNIKISVMAEKLCRRCGLTHLMGSPIIVLMVR